MTLAVICKHGIRSVTAECREIGCGHASSVEVDHRPGAFPLPDVAPRLRCSSGGSRNVKTIPNWNEGRWAHE